MASFNNKWANATASLATSSCATLGLTESEVSVSDERETFKQQRRKTIEEQYSFDSRYTKRVEKNSLMTDKMARGQLDVLPDSMLFDFARVDHNVIRKWFLDLDTSKSFALYEKYRRVCRSLFLSGCYHRLYHLALLFKFVDVRNGQIRSRRKVMIRDIKIICNENLPPSLFEIFDPYGFSRSGLYEKPLREQMLPDFKKFNAVADEFKDKKVVDKLLSYSEKVSESLAMSSDAHMHMSNQVRYVAERTGSVMDKLDDILDSTSSSLRQISDVVLGMLSPFKTLNVASNWIVDLLIDLCVLIWSAVSNTITGCMPTIVMFCGKYLSYSGAIDWMVHTLMELVKPKSELREQSLDDYIGYVPKMSCLLALFGVVIGIASHEGKAWDAETLAELTAKTSVWCNKVFVGGQNAFKSMTALFESFFDDCLVFFGLTPVSIPGRIKARVREFEAYVTKCRTVSYWNQVYKTPKMITELEDWYRIGSDLCREVALLKDSNYQAYFMSLYNYVKEWHNKYIHVTPAPIGNRVRPVVIMLQGDGGVGKSTLANCIANDLIRANYPDIDIESDDFHKNRPQYVYEFRLNPTGTDPYMNGVNTNHRVMIWSEAFQANDTTQNPSEDLFYLMCCVDSAGFQVPQAFESKGKISFEIPYIIITTNRKGKVIGDPALWQSQHALNRRFDFIYNCSVKADCRKPDSHQLDISVLDKDPDAVLFKRITLDMQLAQNGSELPVKEVVDLNYTSYETVLRSALKKNQEYNKIFLNLTKTMPACSRQIKFGDEFRVQMTQDDTATESEHDYETPDEIAGYVRHSVTEKGGKCVTLTFTSADILGTAMSAPIKDYVNLSDEALSRLFENIEYLLSGKIQQLKVFFLIEGFVKKSVFLESDGFKIRVDENDGDLVVRVDLNTFYDETNKSEFEKRQLFGWTTRVRWIQVFDIRSKVIVYVLSMLSRPSTVWKETVLEVIGGTLVEKKDVERFEHLVKRNNRLTALKWIAGVTAGVVGALSLFGIGFWWMNRKSEGKEYEPIQLPVFTEQSDKVENVPRTAARAVSQAPAIRVSNARPQSDKVENVPRSAPKQSAKVSVKTVTSSKVVPLREQYGIQVKEQGKCFTLGPDYDEYFPQSAVRGDPDSNSLRALLWHNTVCIYLCDDEWLPRKRIGNGLFVKSRTMLIPRHYLARLTGDQKFCFYRLQSHVQWKGTIADCYKKEVFYDDGVDANGENVTGKPIDIVSLTFKDVVQFPDIFKHIVTLKDMGSYKSIPAVLTTISPHTSTRNGEDFLTLFVKEYHTLHATATDSFYYGAHKWFVRNGYKYPIATIDGDCGSALTAICRELPRKILGIHVCGNDTIGASVALYQELVQHLLPSDIEMREQCGGPAITLGHFNSTEWNDGMHSEVKDFYHLYHGWFEPEQFVNGELNPEGICVGSTSPFVGSTFVFGKSVYSPKHSDKVKIEPSVLQGRMPYDAKKRVAVVADYLDEKGEVVHIKKKSFDKLHAPFKYIDQQSLVECVQDALLPLYEIDQWEQFARILTIEEAVFGVIEGRSMLGLPPDPYLSCIGSINLNSSCGKVYEKFKRGGSKGKHQWFDLDKKWIDPVIYRAIQDQMLQWEHCYREKDVFSGENKVELRTPPKHLDPRMYNSGDMITMINTKRLFAGIVALMQKHWYETGVTVGINCHKDFRLLMTKLQEKGLDVFDGDFSKFDGSLQAILLLCVMDGFIEFYTNAGVTDIPTNNAMRTCSNCIRFAVVIILGQFVLLYKSNPSGNYLTTQLNSVAVKAGGRLIWREVFKDKPRWRSLVEYNKHVVEVANGDDNVFNVSPAAIVYFNQQTVGEAFERVLGMTYTDADKSGTLVVSKTIRDISYLKRKMTDGDAGALDPDSIRECVLWWKRGVSSADDFGSTLSSAMQEAYHHGPDFFSNLRQSILAGLRGTRYSGVRLLTYSEARDLYHYSMSSGKSFGFTY